MAVRGVAFEHEGKNCRWIRDRYDDPWYLVSDPEDKEVPNTLSAPLRSRLPTSLYGTLSLDILTPDRIARTIYDMLNADCRCIFVTDVHRMPRRILYMHASWEYRCPPEVGLPDYYPATTEDGDDDYYACAPKTGDESMKMVKTIVEILNNDRNLVHFAFGFEYMDAVIRKYGFNYTVANFVK